MWLHFTGSDVLAILDKYGLKIYPEINEIQNDDDITARFKNIFNAFVKHLRVVSALHRAKHRA